MISPTAWKKRPLGLRKKIPDALRITPMVRVEMDGSALAASATTVAA
jgi:hypothetical protein